MDKRYTVHPTSLDPDRRGRCVYAIQQLYEFRNPAKLPELTSVLSRYEGKELLLYLKACQKYGVKPDLELCASTSEYTGFLLKQ